MTSYKDIGLVNTKKMFEKAMAGGYAIPAYNFNNMEQMQAIIQACVETKSPVILQVSAGARKYANQTLLRYMAQGAVEYAKEALRRDPDLRAAHSELNLALRGHIPDWSGCNHYLQIAYYMDFLEQNPNNWRAYMWLMDQLIDDYRLDEAEAFCDRFAEIENSYRVLLYRGMIAWQRGERKIAFSIWAEMEEKYPDEWCVWHNIGDYLVRSGQYEEGLKYYRKALDVQKSPPLLDPLQAIAQLCEIRGDIAGAIAARREEAERIEKEWNVSGEELDAVLRDIQRLERKLIR